MEQKLKSAIELVESVDVNYDTYTTDVLLASILLELRQINSSISQQKQMGLFTGRLGEPKLGE